MKKPLSKILSVVLTLPFAALAATSCGRNDFGIKESTEKTAQTVVDHRVDEQWSKNYNDEDVEIDFEVPVAVTPPYSELVEAEKPNNGQDGGELMDKLPVQDTYEEYVENLKDTESFVYGLMTERLQLEYDVFSAYLTLETTRVYGLGYTSFDEAYTLENDEKTYFGAGFISFIGEPQIPDTEGCLKMTRLGETSEDYGFLYTYSMEDYKAHTVVYNEYVQFGVKDKQLTYKAEKITSRSHLERICDKTLGSLYSYDENKMLLETDFGFTPVNGVSAIENIDYKALQAEIDDILKKQDVQFCKADIVTMVNIGKDALESYLLGLEEEEFCGYSVAALIQIAEDINPIQVIRITSDGLAVVEIEPLPPEPPSLFTKWLVGLFAGLSVAATIVCMIVPCMQVLLPLAGYVSGALVEAACEVIGQNKHLNQLNPLKLCVAGLAGMVSCYAGVVGDALVGGVTNSLFAIIDGGGLAEAATSFAIGTATGLLVGSAVNVALKGVGKIVKAFKVKNVSVIADAVDDTLVKKLDNPVKDAVQYQAGKAAKEAMEESAEKAMQKAANVTDALTDAEIKQARNQAAKSMKELALEGIQNGTDYCGLSYDNPADRQIIEFVQQNGRFPNFATDGIQCEFAHAVDVNEIVKAYNKGLISKSEALTYISDPMNGLLTSHATHFRQLHGGNWKNITDSALAMSKRPEIIDVVEEILRRIGK